MWKLLIIYYFVCVYAIPTDKEEATDYLKKYGYMPSGGEENFHEAMKKFQNFMGIPETGEMDEESSKIMRTPRCGLPDMELQYSGRRSRRYVLQGSRWKLKHLTYKVLRYSKKLNPENVDKELQQSFDMWLKYINKTSQQKVKGNVDIRIGFYEGDHNDGIPFDGSGPVLAHAFFPVFNGDLHFDESEDWTLRTGRGINFKQIALHEIGHSLGLRHSRKKRAVMFPNYYRNKPKLKLHLDDIRGISKLYAKRS